MSKLWFLDGVLEDQNMATNIGMMDSAYFVGRNEILGWINARLQLNLSRIEEVPFWIFHYYVLSFLCLLAWFFGRYFLVGIFQLEFSRNRFYFSRYPELFWPIGGLLKAKHSVDLETWLWKRMLQLLLHVLWTKIEFLCLFMLNFFVFSWSWGVIFG